MDATYKTPTVNENVSPIFLAIETCKVRITGSGRQRIIMWPLNSADNDVEEDAGINVTAWRFSVPKVTNWWALKNDNK